MKKTKLSALEAKALRMCVNRGEVQDSRLPETFLVLYMKGLTSRRCSIISDRNYYAITDAGRAALQKEEGE